MGKYQEIEKIAKDKWLLDEQVGILLEQRLSREKKIKFYNIELYETLYDHNHQELEVFSPNPFEHPEIYKDDDAQKVIGITGFGITTRNIGELLKKNYQPLASGIELERVDPKEFNFVIPVQQSHNHWVLVVLEVDKHRQSKDKIPYKMSYIDSQHDSKRDTDKSQNGLAIFNTLKENGFDLGDSFKDISCKQQSDGWSCGYLVVENAVDIASGAEIRQHSDKDALKEKAAKILKDLADQERSEDARVTKRMAEQGEEAPHTESPPAQQTQPIEASKDLISEIRNTKTLLEDNKPLFADEKQIKDYKKEEVKILLDQQKNFINKKVKEAEKSGSAFKLISKEKQEDGTKIYKYVHPNKFIEEKSEYDEKDCITYYIKDGKTEVVYGENTKNSLVFSMPNEKEGIGAKAIIKKGQSEEIIGDTRNKIEEKPPVAKLDESSSSSHKTRETDISPQ